MSILLRSVNVFIFLITLVIYLSIGFSIWFFLLFILLPDISAISYLINENIGDALYNLVHSYITLFIFFLFFLFTNELFLLEIFLIWLAHISMDRSLGYTLR
ncbi:MULTISPECIES: DUF4260 domain-containing protein [Staphylococcus]|uniref:DUF4260 domain-containing protein n=1 Tax=Staphylococcus TaxID=1279 RepID=UPI0021A36699|nr:DUF4260 domain-containing protein [Staphylococcus epidermidis]MCT1513191.1 DUF4260 domain-containing protein [Staphylococcus epidermidis]